MAFLVPGLALVSAAEENVLLEQIQREPGNPVAQIHAFFITRAEELVFRSSKRMTV